MGPVRTVAASLLLLGAALVAPSTAAAGPVPVTGQDRARAVPRLTVSEVASGLEHAWDVAELPDGALLVTERDRARLSLVRDGRRRTVAFPSDKVWVSGETGLMSVELAPRWGTERRFYTCSGWRTSSGPEIQVRAWRLSRSGRRAVPAGKVLGGIPVTTGRHGGCRVTVDAASGDIWVGTGDSAQSGVSRDRSSLGGKVLRLTALGGPSTENCFTDASFTANTYVYSYGHRNVQGLALDREGRMWSVEHGPDRDDEVNALRECGDYGWDPGPGYDESVPMTDHSLPGQQYTARWSSGIPTVATSGAEWVLGRRWGALAGTLAVATLKGERLMFMRFGARHRFVRAHEPRELTRYGRLRSVTRAANGDLLVTTDNGLSDKVLRISPRR